MACSRSRRSASPFYQHDLELLATLANQTGVALRNARLVADLRKLNEDTARLNNGLASANQQMGKLDSVKTDTALTEPVSIDLYKALKYRNSKYDIVLQDGDVVFVPEINPFVSVKGTVQSPLKLAFDKEHSNVGYYIDKAGGFGQRPWRNRVYVQYANGKSRRTKNIFFLHFILK